MIQKTILLFAQALFMTGYFDKSENLLSIATKKLGLLDFGQRLSETIFLFNGPKRYFGRSLVGKDLEIELKIQLNMVRFYRFTDPVLTGKYLFYTNPRNFFNPLRYNISGEELKIQCDNITHLCKQAKFIGSKCIFSPEDSFMNSRVIRAFGLVSLYVGSLFYTKKSVNLASVIDWIRKLFSLVDVRNSVSSQHFFENLNVPNYFLIEGFKVNPRFAKLRSLAFEKIRIYSQNFSKKYPLWNSIQTVDQIYHIIQKDISFNSKWNAPDLPTLPCTLR